MQDANVLHWFITDNKDTFESMSEWAKKIAFVDLEADEDTVAHELVAAELAAELEWGRDEDHREGHTTKRKRVKSSHKDKAARKRTLNLCKLLWEKLKQVYSRKDARIIFDVIMRGNVPTLSNRDYIQGVEDDSWLISDSLPDPNWT